MSSDEKVSKEPNGKIISFPNGESVTAEDIGSSYVVAAAPSTVTVPQVIDPSDTAKELRDREDFVSRQPLTRAISDRLPTTDVVDHLVKEIVEEVSHLKYERQKAVREGRNPTNITVSRISSLRQLADVLLKRMENARAEQLNLRSPRFREVLKLWMEFVYDSMQKTNVPDEVIDLVFKQMEADMVDWEKRLTETIS